MAELHYRDGGAWRKARELHYRDGGAWRKLKEAWYRDGGMWRKVFSGATVAIPGIVLGNTVPAPSSAALLLYADGTMGATGSDSALDAPNWLTPVEAGVGAGYWARLTVTSGTAPSSGSGAGAWVSLAATVYWEWARSTVGSTTAVVKLEIATDAAGATVVASRSSIPVTVTREP